MISFDSVSYQLCYKLLTFLLLLMVPGRWTQFIASLKDAMFEPSSELRHATDQLNGILNTTLTNKSVLFLYTDGGPDHRTTFVSTQLALIALFLNLNLDISVQLGLLLTTHGEILLNA